MEEQEQPFFTAYLSSDGRYVTDFNGKIVGRVLYYSTIRLPRPSYVQEPDGDCDEALDPYESDDLISLD